MKFAYTRDSSYARRREMPNRRAAVSTRCRRNDNIGPTVLGAPDEPVPNDVPEDLVSAILSARES